MHTLQVAMNFSVAFPIYRIDKMDKVKKIYTPDASKMFLFNKFARSGKLVKEKVGDTILKRLPDVSDRTSFNESVSLARSRCRKRV